MLFLKDKLQRKLNLPWSSACAFRRDVPRQGRLGAGGIQPPRALCRVGVAAAIRERSRWIGEIDNVQDIEDLRPELQTKLLSQRELLEHREVQAALRWPEQLPRMLIAVCSSCLPLEAGRIPPFR